MSLKLSVLAFTAMAVSAAMAPQDALADYAYCSVLSSSMRCDFQTYAQCQASVSGVGADCMANPAGTGTSSSQAAAPVQRAHRRHR